MGEIQVGTASWTDKSLVASKRFYPRGCSSAEARLRYYADHFPWSKWTAAITPCHPKPMRKSGLNAHPLTSHSASKLFAFSLAIRRRPIVAGKQPA